MTDYMLTMPGLRHGYPCDIGIVAYYPAEPDTGKMVPDCDFELVAPDNVRDWLFNNLDRRALDEISAQCCRYVEQLEEQS